MDELVGSSPLIAALGFLRPQARRRPIPLRFKTSDTVEHGMPSSSAISGPVKRSRRSDRIACSRSRGVRFATRLGAEERSSRLASLASL